MTHRDSGPEDLIAGLTEDLAHQYAVVIQYRTFASVVRGPARVALRPRFEEVGDGPSHAGLLADSIVTLGETPTVNSARVPLAEHPAEMQRCALEADTGAEVLAV